MSPTVFHPTFAIAFRILVEKRTLRMGDREGPAQDRALAPLAGMTSDNVPRRRSVGPRGVFRRQLVLEHSISENPLPYFTRFLGPRFRRVFGTGRASISARVLSDGPEHVRVDVSLATHKHYTHSTLVQTNDIRYARQRFAFRVAVNENGRGDWDSRLGPLNRWRRSARGISLPARRVVRLNGVPYRRC
jgi:hypothetical protein